jgi:hypothetical protein
VAWQAKSSGKSGYFCRLKVRHSGDYRFSVFHPYMFARGKNTAGRRKWKRALELALFGRGFSAAPLKKGTPPSARSAASYQRQNFFARVNAGL